MQRNNKRSRRNQQKREDFEATLHAVPDHSPPPRADRGAAKVGAMGRADATQDHHDEVARTKVRHPTSRPAGPPQRTADGLWLRTERDGSFMINVGFTQVQLEELIMLIDDDPESPEINDEVLEAARRKLVNRLNRMKSLIIEQEEEQARKQQQQ